MRETAGEVVAFSDANATWAPDALRQLVANFADPDVAYVCGQLRLEAADGSNREGVYWRYELGLREAESRLGSITGGNGSIYARAPRRTTSRSTRAGATTSRSRTGWCRRGGARSTSPRRTRSRSRRRRTRPSTGARCGCSSTAGRSRCAARCCGGCRPATSSRSSRTGCCATASGVLHLVAARHVSLALVGDGLVYGLVLAAQLAAPRRRGRRGRRSRATTCSSPGRRSSSLWNYLRRGVPATWEAAEGHASVNRALDVAIAGARARAREPAARRRRARDQARGRRPGALPADARRQGRRATSSC